MGFVPVPKQPLTTETWLEAFELVARNAEVVLHHAAVDWLAFSQAADAPRDAQKTPNLEHANFIALMAVRSGLKVFLVVDPLSSDRQEIDPRLTGPIGRSFSDPVIRKAFSNFASRVARDYKPAWLGLGSEINTYLKRHPGETEALLSLLKETAALVKQVSPATLVTTTLQFESLSGVAGGSPDWDLLSRLEPFMDLVSITTYPSAWHASPDDLAADYYSRLARYTRKPVIVAESGWPSGGSAAFHGSEASQGRFVQRFPELIGGLDCRLWIWWFLHDWAGSGYAPQFQDMGLRTSAGVEKPAWAAWQEVHRIPR